MATKRREIYARAAVQLRTHDRAMLAEKKCPGAMGLYFFLLLQARGEATAGTVLEETALCSWGAPRSYRARQLDALIAVGLVERRGDELLYVVRYEEHNDTPEDIAANRKATRDRVQAHRQAKGGDVTRYTAVTDGGCNAFVLNSISPSLSVSGSDQGGAGGSAELPTLTAPEPPESTTAAKGVSSGQTSRGPIELAKRNPGSTSGQRGPVLVAVSSPPPTGQRPLADDEPLTDARRAYVDTVVMGTGEAINADETWARFRNDRIERSLLYASESAIDAGWRKWVDREAKFAREARERRGRRGERQPLDNTQAWLPTGTGNEL